jgi:hypothetical protein
MSMRTWPTVVAALALLSSCSAKADTSAPASQRVAAGQHTTVLVELFTSEGCSSCPAADDELADLVRNQPIANVTVVGLGEHVDYWDNLGWRDVFSSAAFTARQSHYDNSVFRTGSIYTPQAVVDGQFQMVGSDRAAVRRAIQAAARSVKAAVSLNPQPSGANEARATVIVDVPTGLAANHSLDVMYGMVERNLVTNVRSGENGGHVLKHGAVARSLESAGTIKPTERAFSKAVSLPIGASWKKADLQLVAFVQDRTTGQVIGAAVHTLNP